MHVSHTNTVPINFRYDIVNYQRFGKGNQSTYRYVKVGSWDSFNLSMEDSDIYWPSPGQLRGKLVESVCSRPCPKGQVKVCNTPMID